MDKQMDSFYNNNNSNIFKQGNFEVTTFAPNQTTVLVWLIS